MNISLLIGLLLFIGIFLLLRMPKLLLGFVGAASVRIVVGLLLLLLLNVVGNQFGLYLPINIFTVVISSVLGIFGLTSLVAVQLFIL